MQISTITSAVMPHESPTAAASAANDPKLAEASRQFESVLLRQFLSESMKPMLQGGPSGQVYGYMLTDTLADTLSKGGGLGFSSVLQAQLGGIAK